jgi:hypothetical protein
MRNSLFTLVILSFMFTGCKKTTESTSLDADTDAWWKTTAELSNDAMEGRDTGSPGYRRAAAVVGERLAAAGLEPLGDNGTWFQEVAMDEMAITQAVVTVGDRELRFLHDFYAAPGTAPSVDAPLVYCGYCDSTQVKNVKDKLVICHGTSKEGLPGQADRMRVLAKAGALGMITIADPGFTIEPPRWPFAYSRRVTLAGTPTSSSSLLNFRLNAAALEKVIAGSNQNAKELIDLGQALLLRNATYSHQISLVAYPAPIRPLPTRRLYSLRTSMGMGMARQWRAIVFIMVHSMMQHM